LAGIDFQTVIGALVFFLPAYVANTSAGFFGGGAPLDRGMQLWDNRRLFGEGKTMKGTTTGILSGIIYRLVENLVLSKGVLIGLTLAFLLSFGAMAGDLIGSFIKRRIGIESGESAPFLDQLDFAIGALFLASFVVSIPMETIIILLIITPGFLLHRKEVPW
jgi:CDP-2,3-bis-(O-geranylgeranyl)-sn-glycerol synthase